MTNKLARVSAGLLAIALSAGTITSAHAANLITNGSFETGDLTGWTSSYGSLNPFGTTYGSGMDGTYWAWLAGYETPITLSQTVTGLTSGATYTLSWIMASEFFNADAVRVSVNGGAGSLFTAPPYIAGGFNGGFWDNWVSKSLTFTATGTSATIQFDTIGLNIEGYDVGIDKVSLLAGGAPEPATWAMMILGIGAVGFAMRRRRQATVRFAF